MVLYFELSDVLVLVPDDRLLLLGGLVQLGYSVLQLFLGLLVHSGHVGDYAEGLFLLPLEVDLALEGPGSDLILAGLALVRPLLLVDYLLEGAIYLESVAGPSPSRRSWPLSPGPCSRLWPSCRPISWRSSCSCGGFII